MSEDGTQEAESFSTAPAFRLLVLVLFFGSGCAALIYEIVWFQLIQLVIGSSAVSLGMLLAVFMGGMCLGSLVFPRLVSPGRDPLRVYALLEFGIGILGLGVLFLLPQVARFYVANVGHGFSGFLFRGAICVVCLLPPTILMGSTLPAISRGLESSPEGASWLGFFYCGNTIGAVFGCLLAGFYLLRNYDMATATCVAAAINGMVALVAFWLGIAGSRPTSGASRFAAPCGSVPGSWPVYVSIALSGLCALGAEVVWTRLLSLMIGATVYTFSIILAVFLAGLGIGSSVGSMLARATHHPRVALGVCQLSLAMTVAWAAYVLAKSLPFWPINPLLAKTVWLNFQVDLARCAWAVLPPTCLWGASFPLALAAMASPGRDPGQMVGRIYAANTVGAIIGALGCSLFLIGWAGTQQIQRLLIGLSALSGLLMFLPRRSQSDAKPQPAGESNTTQTRGTSFAVALGTACIAACLIYSVPRLPWELVAYGRFLPTKSILGNKLYLGEGRNASVAVTELNNGVRNFHVSGKVEASTDPRDMRLQRMLALIPGLLHPKAQSVLVVGCGAGVTAGSFVVHPKVQRIVICEIEPLIPKVVAQFFGQENYDVVSDPRAQVVYDDARHYILTTKEKFDIITSDPIHPWVKGAATLYTREYFELCKQHLNPGGLVTQWVPLYESNLAVVKSEIATFFEVFPNGTIWSNDDNGEGYDVVLLGQVEPARIDLDQIQERLSSEEYSRLREALKDVGFRSAFGLLATYAGQAPDLGRWMEHSQINRDADLRLQFLAGLGVNFNEQDLILSDLLIYRRFPGELFAGSEEKRQMLRQLIERPGAKR